MDESDALAERPGLGSFDAQGVARLLEHAAALPRQFAANPRAVITANMRLTPEQQELLARTTDVELKSDLQPVIDALIEGKRVQALAVVDVAPDVSDKAANDLAQRMVEVLRPPLQQQQAQQRTITITIGRGRCKVIIMIDL